MELLVTLHKKENLNDVCRLDISGVIFGSLFAHGYKMSLEEMAEVNKTLKKYNYDRYISINSLIQESDLEKLDAYLDFIKELDVDGIYFSDFAVCSKAYEKNMQHKLIYDPYSQNTNKKDILFFANYNMPCVLARELTFNEIMDIAKVCPYTIDMQIFGHLRMSESKRKYITNYFTNFNINENPTDNENYKIREQSRDYKFPIMEDQYGTCIYTDYVFAMFSELKDISKYIKHAIIDDLFLNIDIINEYVRNISMISDDTNDVIKESIIAKNPTITLSNGYLYQKTTDTKVKDEQD